MDKFLIFLISLVPAKTVDTLDFSVIRKDKMFKIHILSDKKMYFTVLLERKGKDGWKKIDEDVRRPYTSVPLISLIQAGKSFEYIFILGKSKPYKIVKNVPYRLVLKYGYSIEDYGKEKSSNEFKY